MKWMLLSITGFFLLTAGILYGASKAQYQMVDVYICGSSPMMAELIAKTTVSRKDLYTVSYCTCTGLTPEMKSEVTRTPCEFPKDNVYTCSCIGKNHY